MYKKCKYGSEKQSAIDVKCVFGLKLLICALLLFPALGSSVSGADKINFNIDFSCGWNGYYRPMEWTPVEIMVGSDIEEPFDSELTLSSQQDGLNTLNISHRLTLTPDLPEYRPLVTKIAYTNQRCTLSLNQVISDRRKRTVWTNEYEVWRSVIPGKNAVLNEQDMLIGIVGMGKFGLLRIDRDSESRFGGTNGNVCIGSKQPRQVPWDWTGFVSLDVLILYDPDWSQLREQQLKAITEWVSNGGKVLVVLGSNPPRGENPLTNIMPFEFQEAKQASLSQSQLYKWHLGGTESETVMLKSLVKKTNARIYTSDIYQDNQYFFGAGYVGFGRVGVLAFDPSDFSDFQNANSTHFWIYFIQALLESEELTNNPRSTQRMIEFAQNRETSPGGSIRSVQYNPYNAYQIGSAYSLNNVVMSFLYSEIKPLSVWFVILLLGALAVLLGPVDYKFLKSIDRLPLTWLTCSFWIILFTVGAYYGVQYIRGGKMQLKAVSVLDGIDDGSAAWTTQYSGLFASKSDSYQLEGMKPDQWWSGIAPSQDQIYAYNSELGSRRIYCEQINGGNLPESLPVNIWDIQCMLTESPIEKLPFSAEVQQNGSNIIVTVKNDSDAAITGGFVLLKNNYGIEFSRVSAHGVQEFQKQRRRLTNWEDIQRRFSQVRQGSISNFQNEAAFFAQGSLQRTRAINDYLDNGAAAVCVTYDKAPLSFSVKDRSFSCEHVQLARLVVFPK